MDIIIVALGGAAGAVSRYLAGNAIGRAIGSSWPYGTFIINIVGCFFMGLLMTLIVGRGLLPANYRLLLCVGFLGGFTTFSSFAFETWSLLLKGEIIPSLVYISGSILLGVAAAAAGCGLGNQLNF